VRIARVDDEQIFSWEDQRVSVLGDWIIEEGMDFIPSVEWRSCWQLVVIEYPYLEGSNNSSSDSVSGDCTINTLTVD
jgi:hypothetical protein